MSEVNEEILEQFLKVVKRWFYIGDIPFAVPRNYSNIDVLGYEPENDRYYDFEVKFRSRFSLTNDGKSISYLTDQFLRHRDSRENKLKEFIGRRRTTKVIVTTYTMMGRSLDKRECMEKNFMIAMKKAGFKSQVWYFDEMIPLLVQSVPERGRYNTQLLQTIRMLKIYGAK